MRTTARRVPFRRAMAVAVAGAAVASLAACGGGSSGGSASGGSSNLTIGIIDFDVSSVGAEVQVVAAQNAFKAAGWKTLNQNSAGDAGHANATCQQYVTRKVSAIAIEVFNGSQMAQCLAVAKPANIPVFFLASALTPGMAGAISTTGAAPINDLFISQFKSTPNLQVLAINYSPGLPCLERKQDFEAKMASSIPSAQITKHEGNFPGAALNAQAATQAWLNGHPAAEFPNLAIWTCASDFAAGALSAENQVGRTNVPVYTWDLGKQMQGPISSGRVNATLIVDPTKMADQAVGMIKDYMSSKQAKSYTAPYLVVTKANVAQTCTDLPDTCK